MTTHVLQFVELSDHDRSAAKAFDKLGKGDQVKIRVRRKSGKDQVVRLPRKAAVLLETALSHLLQGERVAVLAEDQELSPNNVAADRLVEARWTDAIHEEWIRSLTDSLRPHRRVQHQRYECMKYAELR
jgi:hypothetical protein